ncbi:alpha/beta hydrolase [Phanerochaete sordida]|uniref:Alpha/beta hydrolase n=1 Tax=Phanerochaete sordida TaxID=48140 RepID=A0A9P3GIC2_9APHY|nr:alpha/beta hydrolase [Phanerochaete sordida]
MALPWPNIPEGIKSSTARIRDLDMHFLHAGERKAPLVLLLHGFPELSYSWREIILPLSQLGYFVVAPDQRGYGRTTRPAAQGQPVTYEDDLGPYRILNLAQDIVALVQGLGHERAAAVVGHDFGSVVAAHCALARPDMFGGLVCMSAPYAGQAAHPTTWGAEAHAPRAHTSAWAGLNHHLALLHPPMKHYTAYLSTPSANADMRDPPQGLQAFLRAYIHVKSGDWPGNNPHPLQDTAQILKLPHYYIMPIHQTMPEAVEAHAPSPVEVLRNNWLPDEELAVYVEEFGRTGFQGGLNWYRAQVDIKYTEDVGIFAGKKIDVPAMFIGGVKDWGVYQSPGALEKMKEVCTDFRGIALVPNAGHWVQQEHPKEVVQALTGFLGK